jgi:tetratricopeptide (TPR) repeat protein
MAIKGSLKEASLADVCQLLAMGQKTGCLSVTDRSRFGQIFFDRGRITYANIVNRRDRLGDLLVRDGVLDHNQLRELLDAQAREPDRRLGELLLERGLITEEQLRGYIREQVEEAIYHLFTWSQGNFFFEVDQRPEPGEVLLSLNAEGLLLEGARRVDEWSLIEKKIPSFDLIFGVDAKRIRASGVQLTEEQERILPLLDGTRTVQEIIDATGLGEFEVGKALFGLIQAGFAQPVGQRSPSETGRAREAEIQERRNLGIAFYRAGLLQDATREFRRVLELYPDDAVARYHLVLLELREGKDREAVRRLKALIEQMGPDYGAFINLAYALTRLGRFSDALLALDEADALRPGTPVAALARSRVQLKAGDPAAATQSLEEYRRRLGADEVPSALYYHHAALAAALSGDLEAAEAAAREGLERHPDSPPLLLIAGSIAERRGDLDEAERLYREAAEEDPTIVQAHKNLGDVAYRRGRYEEALEHYERAVELAPELGDDVYTRLGNLYYRQRAREEAMRCWRRALELNPENHVVRNNLEVAADAIG